MLFRAGLLVILLCSSHDLLAVTLSGTTRIEAVVVHDDLGIVRLEVEPNVAITNSGCASGTHVDIRLDAANRTASEQQVLLNLINMAFIGRRNVRLYLLDATDPNPCSTVGTSNSIRVAVGIQVID
jgi:hypothetical protein